MTWSIAEVVRMARVTPRTLLHYDQVGLLKPAYVAGYDYYEQEQLLRLQRLLLLRELGLGLNAKRDERDDKVLASDAGRRRP